MTEINQVFYAIFTVVAIGVSLNEHLGLKTYQIGVLRPEFFWSISASLMGVCCFSWAIAPVAGFFFLTIASFAIVSSMLGVGFIFRSLNQVVSKKIMYFSLLGLLAFLLLFEFLRLQNDYLSRVLLVSVSLVGIHLFQLFELRKLMLKEQSFHLKLIVFVLLFQIIMLFVRIDNAFRVGHLGIFNLYQETGVRFYIRMLLTALYLLTFVLIGNYFYDKLWKKANQQAVKNEANMLLSLNSLSLARDNETGNHILRTQRYVERIALRLRQMGYFAQELSDRCIHHLVKAAPLHDIGKVAIPDKVLLKEGKLTVEEMELMKTHALVGERVLSAAESGLNEGDEDDVIAKAIKIAGGHHEKWDGTGYPRGLSGELIPLEARIMAIADMYDALVSERVYKNEWSHEQAVDKILGENGVRFDPRIVEAFLLEADNFNAIAQELKD